MIFLVGLTMFQMISNHTVLDSADYRNFFFFIAKKDLLDIRGDWILEKDSHFW